VQLAHAVPFQWVPGAQWHAVRSGVTHRSQLRQAVSPGHGASVPSGHVVQALAIGAPL
jgi:hypothetical protein